MIQMKKYAILLAMVLVTILFNQPVRSFSQNSGKDYAELNFYRVKQGALSGANSVEVKIMLNDKEIGALSNGTKLTYKLFSEGIVKIKCIATFGSSVIGQPYTLTRNIKHGEVIHIDLEGSSMKGVKGEVLDKKKTNDLADEEWADQSVRQEDKSDPVKFDLTDESRGKDDKVNCAVFYFYRVKQSAISGANSVEVKIMMNDKEIGALSNSTTLTYKIFSEGTVKLKCTAMFGGGVIGQPYTITMEVKHGEAYYFGIRASSMNGVKGEILDEEDKSDMEKEEWADQIVCKEDLSDPVIKK
jgi:hypothetical protein